MSDVCAVIANSGHRSGSPCGQSGRFSVRNANGGTTVRACGQHVGVAIEEASAPGDRRVLVVPDFYRVGR